MQEVRRYQLEIVRLTSRHSLGSGTSSSREAGLFSGIAHGEWWRACVALLIAPQLSPHGLEFTSLHLRIGDRPLTLVSAYGSNSSAQYLAFLESLEGVLDGAPTGYSTVLLWEFNTHMGNDSETWKGTISPI